MRQKVDWYFSTISMAVMETSENRGTLRKAIWNYMQENFGEEVNYRDFLHCVASLIKQGKLVNNNGHFTVQPRVLDSLIETASTKKSVHSMFNTQPSQALQSAKRQPSKNFKTPVQQGFSGGKLTGKRGLGPAPQAGSASASGNTSNRKIAPSRTAQNSVSATPKPMLSVNLEKCQIRRETQLKLDSYWIKQSAKRV